MLFPNSKANQKKAEFLKQNGQMDEANKVLASAVGVVAHVCVLWRMCSSTLVTKVKYPHFYIISP